MRLKKSSRRMPAAGAERGGEGAPASPWLQRGALLGLLLLLLLLLFSSSPATLQIGGHVYPRPPPLDVPPPAPSAAAGAQAWPPAGRAAWPSAREDGFSSWECLGGSQVFDRGYGTQRTAHLFPEPHNKFMRLCLLRDVCFTSDGELQYFANPALEGELPPHLSLRGFAAEAAEIKGNRSRRLAAGWGGLVELDYTMAWLGAPNAPLFTGSRYAESFVPTVVDGPRPRHLPWFPSFASVHALNRFSFANNWGHLLADTILPAFAALDVWGFNHSSLQLLDLHSCDTMYNHDYPLEFLPGKVHADLCKVNVERWLAPAFAHPLVSAPAYHGACFRQLLVGHGGAFSLKGLYHHRAAAVRALRAVLHRALGVSEPPITAHAILVLEKTGQSNGVALPGLCSAVRGAARRLAPAVHVACAQPSLLGSREQLQLVNNATLVVCENGSTGYLAAFLRPGASFLSVLSPAEDVAKEPQTLLFLADVQTFYSSFADFSAHGSAQLLLGVERAGVRLGLPAVTLSSAPAVVA